MYAFSAERLFRASRLPKPRQRAPAVVGDPRKARVAPNPATVALAGFSCAGSKGLRGLRIGASWLAIS
eukprot:5951634-Alexandrium_andersonii.AAC.1